MEIETKDEVKQPDVSTYNREEIVNQIRSHPMKIVTVDAEMARRGLQLTRERSQPSVCSLSLSRDCYLSSGVTLFTLRISEVHTSLLLYCGPKKMFKICQKRKK